MARFDSLEDWEFRRDEWAYEQEPIKRYRCPECGLPVETQGQFCGDCLNQIG